MTDTARASQSEALYRRALKVMPGGVSRNTVLRKPHPLYAAHASGCRITDVDGVERIDFANNMASLIHGHGHPAIVAAVTEKLRRGTAHTLATEVELRFAEHLCERVDSFEQLRFVNSGTEAVMCAIDGLERVEAVGPACRSAKSTSQPSASISNEQSNSIGQELQPYRWARPRDRAAVYGSVRARPFSRDASQMRHSIPTAAHSARSEMRTASGTSSGSGRGPSPSKGRFSSMSP